MEEMRSVAAARGVDIAADLKFKTVDVFLKLDPGWKTPMCNDLEAGKRIEIASLSGTVHRHGAKLGMPTPIHSLTDRALKHYAEARR